MKKIFKNGIVVIEREGIWNANVSIQESILDLDGQPLFMFFQSREESEKEAIDYLYFMIYEQYLKKCQDYDKLKNFLDGKEAGYHEHRIV